MHCSDPKKPMSNTSPAFELIRLIDVTAQGGTKPVPVPAAESSSVSFSNAHGGLRKVTYVEARSLGETSGKSLTNALRDAAL